MIYEYVDYVKGTGYFEFRRNEQSKYWMYESINEHLRSSFYNNEVVQQRLKAAENAVLGGEKTSFMAANDLLETYFDRLKQ